MISLRGVDKQFQSHAVLKNVNLEIKPGEFLTILGPSGCGKSTLLRILSRLETPTRGEWLGPQNSNLNLSYVFQESELLPWRNVEENVLLPLELKKKNLDADHVHSVLTLVQLEKFKKLYPHQLSGGMKMRVSIARALITDPDLLLMDEPFSSLDETTRFEMQNQLIKLKKIKNKTIVFVTHSITEAVYLSDRIQVFSAREGCSVGEKVIDLGAERKDEIRTGFAYNAYVTELSRMMKSAKQDSVYEI